MKYFTLLFLSILFIFADKQSSMAATPKEFSATRGVNISHWLSQSNKRGENRKNYFTRKDVAYLAQVGFDHLRIPIDEEQMFTATGEKEPEAFALLHQALGWCRELGLNAVVDLHILRSHHFNDKVKPLFTDTRAQESFYECWRQLSDELKRYPNSFLAYELMNEPVADDHQEWNRIANRCIEVVREKEKKRTVIVGSNLWQGYQTVKYLKLPDNDKNIWISFHYYEPFLLTHHRASWTDMKDFPFSVHYPGTTIDRREFEQASKEIQNRYRWVLDKRHDRKVIEENFKEVLQTARQWGLKVYCGEYGCIDAAPYADQMRWFRDMNAVFDRLKIGRAVWDYKGGFGLIKNGVEQHELIRILTGSVVPKIPFAPLAKHPNNPKYFLFRNRPTLLITSGEHYGALINGEFDYTTYLETLHQDGLNNTRIFTGVYVEPAGAFNITNNTLGPTQEKMVMPWKRNKGGLYDLSQWNEAYFARLHGLMQTASRLGIVVEITLFCPYYEDSQWQISPLNAQNNIQGIGKIGHLEVLQLDTEPALLEIQKKLTEKLVKELNRYDNLYFEICNEPYFGGVTMEWQRAITDLIAATEKKLPNRHLISINVNNGTGRVEAPHQAWGLLNFHYCTPPAAIADNAHLPLPIGMNETGFKGTEIDYYRREAWEFMLAGGALYNNLDYSFTVGHEMGDYALKPPTPGSGGTILRQQLGSMARFLNGMDFISMKPCKEASKVVTNKKGEGLTRYVLQEEGKQIAFYCRKNPSTIILSLTNGEYRGVALDVTEDKLYPVSVSVSASEKGELLLPSAIRNEVAVYLKKIIK